MASLPQHLDLHLIRILYLLLVEKNVSRVALKLNQPQPSISASLRKLRELTGDPLLVRGARGMVPTQHGESLLKPAKRILDETESLFVKKSPFVPEEAARTFHIAAPDYLDTPVPAERGGRMRRGSPNSKVVIHGLGPGTDYLRMLSDGEMDLVIANWDEPPAHLHISKLFEDPIICTMRADSPYAKRTAATR
jgi:DNA-binding transcriptional LysR family regulator